MCFPVQGAFAWGLYSAAYPLLPRFVLDLHRSIALRVRLVVDCAELVDVIIVRCPNQDCHRPAAAYYPLR